MGKGVLLELQGRKAVVLTPQGEFKSVPVPSGNWEIGAEIEFAEESRTPVWQRWGVAAAAVLLLALAPVGYNSWALAQPVAIVTVDINPSLELTLNKQGDVLNARGLNADGDAVLSHVTYKRKPVADVVAAVTEAAIEIGKLNPGDESGTVVVAVAPAGNKDLAPAVSDKFAAAARTGAEKEVQQHAQEKGVAPKAHVAAVEVTAAEKQQASKDGLTPGLEKVLQGIQAVVPTAKPEDLKAAGGPGKYMHQLGISPSTVFTNAQEHQDKTKPESNKGQEKKDSGTKEQPKGQEQEKDKEKDKPKSSSQEAPAVPKDAGSPAKDQSKDQSKEKGKEPQGQPATTPDKDKKENGKAPGKTGEDLPAIRIEGPVLGNLAPGGGDPAAPGQGQGVTPGQSPNTGQDKPAGQGNGQSKGNDQTPSKGNDQTPSKGSDQSPSKGNDQTPSKGSDQSPSKGNDQTPSKGNDQTPSKGSDQSPSQGGGQGKGNTSGESGSGNGQGNGNGGKKK